MIAISQSVTQAGQREQRVRVGECERDGAVHNTAKNGSNKIVAVHCYYLVSDIGVGTELDQAGDGFEVTRFSCEHQGRLSLLMMREPQSSSESK